MQAPLQAGCLEFANLEAKKPQLPQPPTITEHFTICTEQSAAVFVDPPDLATKMQPQGRRATEVWTCLDIIVIEMLAIFSLSSLRQSADLDVLSTSLDISLAIS